MIKFKTKLERRDNEFGFVIPQEIVEKYNLKEEEKVIITFLERDYKGFIHATILIN